MQQLKKHGIGSITSIHIKKWFSLVVTPFGGHQEYGLWKEVTVAAIEMGVGTSGFEKGEARRKLSNNSALVAQSTLVIKKITL